MICENQSSATPPPPWAGRGPLPKRRPPVGTVSEEADLKKERRRKSVQKWASKNKNRRREYMRRYNAANPERQYENHLRWRLANRERRLIYGRKWADSHRELVNSRAKLSYRKHIVKRKAAARIYQIEHSEERRAYAKKYHPKHYADNRERLIAQTTAYKKAHPEVGRLASKNWQKRHPEKYRAHNRAGSVARKVRMRGATVNCPVVNRLIRKWKMEKYFTCYYCKNRFSTERLHIDHVLAIAAGGQHAAENICRSCDTCNLKKKDRPLSALSFIAEGLLSL